MSPPSSIGAEACIPNPALEPLAFLIGEWRTHGTHPMVPGEALNGRASFAWHQGGAFLIVHSEMNHPLFPSGVAIVGSDDGTGALRMIYFDERGVSRHYEVSAGEDEATWRRDDPELSQTLTIRAEGADRLVSRGRMSRKGGEWEDDLSQVYERAAPETP